MKQIRKRLTYANVMSSMAVFLVISGGAAIAAGGLGKGTVGSKQLKKNAVTIAKIKKDAVTSAKVKDASLLAVDFASGQLPIGPKGDKGETGAKGEPGPTASAFAENSTGTALESSPTIINQVTITTKIQSRLIAQASIDVDGAAGANLYCFITDDPSLSGSKDWSVRTNDDFTDNLNTGVIGSKVLPPGTYTIFAACGKNGAPALEYIESDFAVIAAGS